MKDVKELPYAGWLEECIRRLADMDAETIAMAAILPGGECFTAYFNASLQDKLIMAGNIHMDVMLDMTKVNAREILRAAEEQEEEDDDV